MGTEGDTRMYFCLEGKPFVYGQAIQELTADELTDDFLGLRDPGDIAIEGWFEPGLLAWPQLLGIYRLIKKGRKLTGRLQEVRP